MIDHLPDILFLGAIFSMFFWLGVQIYIGIQKEKHLGHSTKKPLFPDCRETARMMVEFIRERMDGKARQDKECSVGCDGYATMDDSGDIAEMVRLVHCTGCRIVVRKVSEEDIEDPSNDKDTVCRFLDDLDIKKAKRVEKEIYGRERSELE